MANLVTSDQVSGQIAPMIGRGGERLAPGAINQGDGTGALLVQVMTEVPSSTSSLSQVAAAISSQQLIAANPNRKELYIFNNQGANTANLYVALTSAPATTTAFTFRLAPNTGMSLPVDYTGAITGIWDAATGSAQMTEFT